MDDVDKFQRDSLREPQLNVINYIENTFKQINHDIQIRPCGHPSIRLRHITSVKARSLDDGWDVVDREMNICFPGKGKEEGWRFGWFNNGYRQLELTLLVACAGKILSEIHNTILEGEFITKRYCQSVKFIFHY
jgi:hypothetical protein